MGGYKYPRRTRHVFTHTRPGGGGERTLNVRDTGDETKTANIQVQFIDDATDRGGERLKKKKPTYTRTHGYERNNTLG